MKNIIFIAPPAAGKGTYSKLLQDKYNIPHISTGDLLRDEVNKGTSLGQEIAEDMKTGKLISDDIITNLLKNRLKEEDCNNGYILDGYPRNIAQAKTYEEMLASLNKDLGLVIYLEVDKDLALNRALYRVVCPNCGASFNTKIDAFKPKEDGICDICHHQLETRKDDTEETFLKRFDTYLENTSALINYYQEKGVLRKIKSENNDTNEIMLNKIRGVIND